MRMLNPLLDDALLPDFAAIRPAHVLPAVQARLDALEAGIAAIVAPQTPRDFAHVLLAEERLQQALARTWSPVAHLHAVADSAELRAAYAEAEQRITEVQARLGQHRGLYEAVRAVRERADFDQLGAAERALVEHTLRDFKLSGVALDEPARTRFRTIAQELSRLGTGFEEAVLDAGEAWREHITDERDLVGLPPSAREILAGYARAAGLDGFLITLQQPAVQAVLTHAEDRALRERVYWAWNTRASDQGPQAGRYDNTPRIAQILALRHEAAQLLGYANAAALSLADKMAPDVAAVRAFLDDLVQRAHPRAVDERETLRAYAAAELGLPDLESWDVAWAAEKLRVARYALDEEQIKAYFPLPQVLDGLFAILTRVFGIRVRESSAAPVWHPDVRYAEVFDADGQLRAGIYLDLYARRGKRGGAWMDVCRSRLRSAQDAQLPVAFLTCNFAAPGRDAPALLTHDDVQTLFHEMGHVLHHLLTEVDLPGVGGIDGVEWDAVELPSQFMENFAWQREALDLFARHHQTQQHLPDALYQRMLDARHFHAGLHLLRQLEFALYDLRLHAEYDPAQGPRTLALLAEVRRSVAVMLPPAWQRFPQAFTHIFAGGYAAGYYGYLWAEVLAADAFARFADEGVFNATTGAAFRREILAAGASRPALDSFRAFRGRDPDPLPLLRSYGLAA